MRTLLILLIALITLPRFSTCLAADNPWIGKKIIILPKPLDQQRYGYSDLRRSDGGYIIPTYEECAGKIATVSKVETPDRGDKFVYLTLDENGKEYRAVGTIGSIPCLAPAADLEDARTRWHGKSIWVKWSNQLLKTDGSPVRAADSVRNFSAVQLNSIVAGYNYERPVRLVLTQDERTFWADLSMSEADSNAYQFSDLLFAENPRTVHPWSNEIWNSIEKGEISTGMTMEQVMMSWRNPGAITKIEGEHCDCQEWEYEKTTLHFRDGKLDEVRE